ncbi:30503_t:CDS:2, partial [Racocetra persica]
LLIIASKDIPKSIRFDIWDEVESYLNEYGTRNSFAHINLSILERATQIAITTYVNKHNHIFLPKIRSFEIKYQLLSKEALDEINIITKHSNLSLIVQKSLLKARFSDLNFQDQDLVNEIQKAKSTTKISNDTSVLLTTLMQKKLEDPCWVVDFELDNNNHLTHLF